MLVKGAPEDHVTLIGMHWIELFLVLTIYLNYVYVYIVHKLQIILNRI